MFFRSFVCWQHVEGLESRFIFFCPVSLLKSVGGLAAISSTCGVANVFVCFIFSLILRVFA